VRDFTSSAVMDTRMLPLWMISTAMFLITREETTNLMKFKGGGTFKGEDNGVIATA
jgi:hypothetical protein